jgi:hypothetical protein
MLRQTLETAESYTKESSIPRKPNLIRSKIDATTNNIAFVESGTPDVTGANIEEYLAIISMLLLR